ncbi:HAD family hydrolase [Patescibacteria group bacterium]|nr:HAD family hydrolase [Patescibacteria group bacterium]
MEQRYYIFDWDGVFADSFTASVQANFNMGTRESIEDAAQHVIKYSSNPHTHLRTSSREQIITADRWTERYASFLIYEEIPLFQEFIDEVTKIPNAQFAIVSSGPGIVIRKLLRQVDIDFTHVLAYEDHHSKEEKVEHICRDWGIDVGNAYYFTDTITDVLELQSIMDTSKIIGCAWGYLGYDALRTVLPDHQILKTFTDIHTIHG